MQQVGKILSAICMNFIQESSQHFTCENVRACLIHQYFGCINNFRSDVLEIASQLLKRTLFSSGACELHDCPVQIVIKLYLMSLNIYQPKFQPLSFSTRNSPRVGRTPIIILQNWQSKEQSG